MIVSVALPIPVETLFDFTLREDRPAEAVIGRRVLVRFSGAETWGVAVAARERSGNDSSLEPILVVGPPPAFSPDLLEFCAALCRDTCSPLGILLNRTLPRRASRAAPPARRVAVAAPLPDALSFIERARRRAPRQVAALQRLLTADAALPESELGLSRASVDRLIATGLLSATAEAPLPREAGWPAEWPRTGRVLLHGEDRVATYRRLLEGAAAGGRQALLLVPEILLAHRLFRRLGGERSGGALYHSGLAEGAQGATWNRVEDGSVSWVVGTRSAVFLPFRDLALVIVDEEQDPSHKQSDMLPYFHARRAAAARVREGLLVLGSAAPSVETGRGVEGGIHRIVVGGAPAVREWQFVAPESPSRILSSELLSDIAGTLASGRRVLVGAPRRGYFPAVVCRSCRRPVRCAACGTNLSVGARGQGAACPACGLVPAPLRCGHCASTDIAFVGFGTLRIEEELAARFPTADLLRIDADAGLRKPSDELLDRLEEGADIVLGTASLAKGPSLARVGLVVVLDIDRRLAAPDFRARERAFQYLANLAALGGPARIVVVTQTPDRSVFRLVRAGDYDGFLRSELPDREAFSYPPFSCLARVVVTRADRGRREADGRRLRQELASAPIQLLGPTPDPKDARRAVFLIKAKSRDVLLDACRRLLGTDLPVQVDIDPERL